ncbi:PTS lactose transporter subunit IIB [Lentilactobacillus sp. Marseille-Q4993]|uniref:PTS sugar transporter subunit IIB n=1 Tax=Lentilactobacillus sp. Marseille-Q4993 TaxID=3039492 RepID=UPI0024BC2197|nr:PTS lactose transporter subunit IIB [Lentilactobacillus sp. Marseille-Q4993]
MKKVLLVCESGISSKFLAKSAERFIEAGNIQIEIESTDLSQCATYLTSDVDLVLLAPQASFKDEEIRLIGSKKAVEVIPDDVYGWANGERLVKFINKMIPSHAEAI